MRTCVFVLMLAAILPAQPRAATYSTLTEGQMVGGFRTLAIYLDDSGRPMGARFQHVRSAFTLDLLSIQSVPQAFIWVTTFPTSDKGEPHTQEHLVLGKGDKGRNLGSQEVFSLVNSSAFTMKWMTCFHFYTSARADVFYQHFERTMDALMHPDYTDEEVRREVRNFGVAADPADGSLRLEEKGTVYNEMVASMDSPNYRLSRAAELAIYGPEHPLAFESGGLPAALRVIRPDDIRRFHAEHYFLGNMGVIASLPQNIDLEAALKRFDAALNRLEPQPPPLKPVREDQLPAPRPAPPGRIELVPYPFRSDQQPSAAILVWPADRQLSSREFDLLSLVLDNVAGDPDTNLYRRLVDSRTRHADLGVQGVRAVPWPQQGNPVFLIFENLPASRINERQLRELRDEVMDEMGRIAAYPDGSPELASFQERLKGRVLQQRRELAKLVNSPPGRTGFSISANSTRIQVFANG